MLTKKQALRRFRLAVSLFFFIQGVVFATWTNRIADLKRWGDGMDRRGQEPQNESIVIANGQDLYIPADDYRFTWPIPQSEKNANPAIKNQTNW